MWHYGPHWPCFFSQTINLPRYFGKTYYISCIIVFQLVVSLPFLWNLDWQVFSYLRVLSTMCKRTFPFLDVFFLQNELLHKTERL